MIAIIAGSRKIGSYRIVRDAIDYSGWADQITEVVSGRARGVDLLGERWAAENNIPVKPFEVTGEDWREFGRKAGCLRNREMAAYAAPDGVLILVWDGKSTGSSNMLAEAKLAGLKIFQHQCRLF